MVMPIPLCSTESNHTTSGPPIYTESDAGVDAGLGMKERMAYKTIPASVEGTAHLERTWPGEKPGGKEYL